MSPSSTLEALKKVAAILKEVMQAADRIIDLDHQITALEEQQVALWSRALENYISIPDYITKRTLNTVKLKISLLESEREKVILQIQSCAKRVSQLPGPHVESYLHSRLTDIVPLGTSPVRCSTLLDWFMHIKDGLAREAVAITGNHAHDLFAHYLDADTVSLVIDTANA